MKRNCMNNGLKRGIASSSVFDEYLKFRVNLYISYHWYNLGRFLYRRAVSISLLLVLVEGT